MKSLAVIATLLALLGVVLFAAWHTWVALDSVTISTQGMIALVLGAFLTFALGAGLMFLVFYSSRHGYDEPDRSSPPDSRE